MPKLLLFLQDGDAREILFDKDRITIGRRSDNDVVLSFPSVSGRHAAITYQSTDKCFVEDLKSTNGTLLNGAPIYAREQLKDRDQVDVGGQKFVYLEGTKGGASTVTASPPRPLPAAAQNTAPLTLPADEKISVPAFELTPSHEYLAARETVPMDPIPRYKEIFAGDDEDEDEHSGLLFPTIFKTPSGDPPRRQPRKEPAPLPELDAGMVPPADDDTLPGGIPPVVPPVAEIEAMSGPSEKRKLSLYHGGDYVLGRPGLQLAVVRVAEEGCRLLPMQGDSPLEMHGATVPAEGVLLADQDTFTVGRSLLRFHLLRPVAG